MFDFAWTEIALIGVVALVAIGPKDLPVAIKTVAGFVKKARKMAGEFQGHVDEMVREANLHEVRDQINQLKNFDLKGEIEKHVDSDGSLRSTFNENPLAPTPVSDFSAPVTEVSEHSAHVIAAPSVPAPAFIPPTDDIVAPPPPAPPPPVPPAFLPPETVAPEMVATEPHAAAPDSTTQAHKAG